MLRSQVALRLIGAALLVLGASAIFSSAHTIAEERRVLLEQMDAQGNTLARATATFCVEPMLVDDFPVLETCVETLTREDTNIVFARVVRIDGRTVAVFPRDTAENDNPDPTLRTYAADILATDKDQNRLGQVVIGMSDRAFEALAAQRGWTLAKQSIATFIILGVVISLLVRRTVGTPLRELDLRAQALGRGDLETPIHIDAAAELGRLAQTLDEMRENLRSGYREIQEQNRQLRKLDKLKSEFLANMSHELRTPMNGVIGMAELLIDTDLNRDQREYVDTIHKSADQLLGVLNDILDFAAVESGRLKTERLPFDVTAAVEDTAERFAENAHAKGLDIGTLIDPRVPRMLSGDAKRLRQVLASLVGNAVKFTSRGRVVIRAEQAEVTSESVVVRFQVEDTGMGIAREVLERLFQPFTQADGSSTRRFGGIGVGLVLAKRLVGLMGGDIGVESEPGRGSMFWFTVPLARCPDSTPARFARTPSVKMRALFVSAAPESDPEATPMTLDLLSESGLDLEVLSAPAESCRIVREAADEGRPYDVVFLESLYGLNPMPIARSIHEVTHKNGPAIVLFTTPANSPSPDERNRVGIVECLVKPVRRAKLARCMEGVHSLRKLLPPALPSSTAKAALSGGARSRVLLAEDNEINQMTLLLALRNLGLDADVASNGREAIEAHERVPYDLILMDCQMPEVDGYDATAEIRRREAGIRRTPIVAVTAHAMPTDRDRCFAVGMDGYLAKPIRMNELKEVLERFVIASPAR